MLGVKLILKHFSKWAATEEVVNKSGISQFFKYIVGGKKGIFATDGRRLISTPFFCREKGNLFDREGIVQNVEIPKGIEYSGYNTVDELVNGYLFKRHDKILDGKENNILCKDAIKIYLEDLRKLRRTFDYIISMFKGGTEVGVLNPNVTLKVSEGNLLVESIIGKRVAISIKFDIGIEGDWKGVFNPELLKDLTSLLIDTRTLEFNLSITKDKAPAILVESNEFTALICGIRVIK